MAQDKSVQIIIYRYDEIDSESLENFIRAVKGETKFYKFENGRFEEM